MKHPPETARPASPGRDTGRKMTVSAGSLDASDSTTIRPPAPTEIPARRRWISPEVAERRRWLAGLAARYALAGELQLAAHAVFVLGLLARRQAVTA